MQNRTPADSRCRVLLQVATDNDDLPTDDGRTSKGDMAAEHQDVAGHRPIDENVAGEHSYTSGGVSADLGGAEDAAYIVGLLTSGNSKVASNLQYIWSGP